ncbi:MAG: hypothetical protein IID45_09565 [Planctomycetes bacterium]|nr:hypothetical protein [Planctomycetota bacterium]
MMAEWQAVAKSRRRLRTVLIVLAAVLPLLGTIPGCADGGAGKEPADSTKALPKLENIDGIKARLAQPQPVIPRFDVPRDHWNAILAGLSTARFDFDPAKWEMMGTLDITRKEEGDSVRVTLYFARGDGAFKIDGQYYRGGKSKELETAIRKAYAEYKTGGRK